MSVAKGASADGSVIAGYSSTIASGTHAFRWTSGTMTDLGNLGSDSYAAGLSTDGKVVVGYSYISSSGSSTLGFRWTQATGMQSVENWLRANGVSIPTDVTSQANATNADGSVVVGTLKNHHAFIARVASSSSTSGSGLIDTVDFGNSLNVSAAGSSNALQTNATLINGAHGQPLMRRVDTGKSTFWVAGDWGRDDYGARSGDIGLAEVGLGHNFGAFQLNLSAGQTWTKQDLVFNGSAQTDGTYLLAEALVPVSGNLWATFGGYGQWGQADLNRGYLNATLQDYSKGSSDLNTWGMRARLDWENFLSLGNGSVTPFVDLTYSEAKMSAYTETGGGFAAHFDGRNDRATTFRLGANGTWPLVGTTHLLTSLEVDHRFEKTTAATNGQVLGLSEFSVPGESVRQDWLRAGVGIEGKVGNGVASLSVNATSNGDMPNYWVAANWRMTF